jgi:hypothetical protein
MHSTSVKTVIQVQLSESSNPRGRSKGPMGKRECFALKSE